MSSSSRSHSRIAHVEDAEEDSGSSINGIEGTRKYAVSEAYMSPIKIQPNSGKSRSDKRLVNSRSSSTSVSFDESGASSDKRGKPLTRRTADREYGDLEPRIHDRGRRRREHRLRDEEDEEDEEEHRRAAAAAAAQAKAAKVKAKEQDARPLRKQRPTSLKSSATQPVIQQMYKRGHVDNPANYGIQQPAITANRPRAQTRPASYYAGQPMRPAPISMAWYPPPLPAPRPIPVGSYPPPPTWHGHGPGASPGGFAGPPLPSPVGPPAGYFDGGVMAANPHSHLRSRFDTRPSSAMGYHRPSPAPPPRPPPSLDYHDPEEFTGEPPPVSRPTRRPPRRAEDDRRRMPPPEHIPIRPQSALPPSTPYRPPPLSHRPPSRQSQSRPPPAHRRSVGFADQAGSDDDDFLGDDGLFHDNSPNASFDQRQAVARRLRRASIAYDNHDYDLVPATSRVRRSSLYGSALPSGGVSLDDKKYTDALKYQEAIGGAPQMPLTAEMLRKAGKRGAAASSRSTRSSGSRDDSEFKRSNATGITRTSFNSDDFTIKVSGGARVRVPGAEIECEDGGEITFSTRPSGSRLASDKASLMYSQLEDSRSRLDHRTLPYRPRAPSQSDSQSRGYAPSHVDYDFPGGYI
ncbi:hypothetical protein VCV18_010493 [Metarhizium anisopliae]